jgi:hypothetical protein
MVRLVQKTENRELVFPDLYGLFTGGTVMRSWIVILAFAGLVGCEGGCNGGTTTPPGGSGSGTTTAPASSGSGTTTAPAQKELTILFDGLVTYVQDSDGDGVTVLLVDSRTDRAGDDIPVHVPIVTFDSSNGEVLNEVPWVLSREDIEIKLEPSPAPNHLDVDPNVWNWTGSLSQITGSAIKPTILNMGNAPNEVVARVRLEHGRLEVDSRPGAIYDKTATFATAGGTPHPGGYSTPKVALLLKYTVKANDITLNSYPLGGLGGPAVKRSFSPNAQTLRVLVGNIPALPEHGDMGVDKHFARFYGLLSTPPADPYLPKFSRPAVGTRVCMGGGG